MSAEKSYREWSPSQSFLLPPSPMDWLPEGHLCYFVLDVVGQVDLSEIDRAVQAKDPRGARPFSPAMMVALLVYGYCLGVRSSRKIERATYEDVAFRVLAGGNHPDHTRISEFRRVHLEALSGLFLQVLQLCQKAGLVNLGRVSIDGTKVQANASKHKAMSYERMVESERRLEAEVERLLSEAERVDREEDERFGVGQREEDLPEELRRREDRLRKIRQARAELEAEAKASRAKQLRVRAARARDRADQSESAAARKNNLTRAERAEREAEELGGTEPLAPGRPGELAGHQVRTTANGMPHPKAQRNFTDSESQIMQSGGTFLQGYNCQVAVDGGSQVILAADVTNKSPDNNNLAPMVEQVVGNCGGAPGIVIADCGYWTSTVSEEVSRLGSDPYIATEGRRQWDRDATPTEEPPPFDLPPLEAMRWKMRTTDGREIYAERKSTAEPVFGQIKEGRGFRRFLLRGRDAVRGEWLLVCATHNLLKLFRSSPGSVAA